MLNKVKTIDEVLRRVSDGSTLLVGGFGVPGTPFNLIDPLVERGVKDLTIVKNEANEAGTGVSRLIENGQVRKVITSHIGLNPIVVDMRNKGQIEVEFFPQGILAEKLRSGGSGLGGFLTDIGVNTLIENNKQVVNVDGRRWILEKAVRGDVSLVHAKKGDTFGNLTYSKSARNFNPLVAMAGDYVIAEVEELVPLGDIDPEEVITSGAFVDAVIKIEKLSPSYRVIPGRNRGKRNETA